MTSRKHDVDLLLHGDLIYLRRPTLDDAENGPWYSWFNDAESTRFTRHGEEENTREDQIEFYKQAVGDESRRVFAICDRTSEQMIGVTSLQEIDLVNRKAEIAIMVGEASYRGKSVSLEAWGLLVQYGFQNLAIDKIWAGSHGELRRWVSSLSAIGFEIEAEIPNEYFEDGKYSSLIRYACYRTRFEELANKNGPFDAATWL
jgi:RimJ/RimL family protein N-acetyltransferase